MRHSFVIFLQVKLSSLHQWVSLTSCQTVSLMRMTAGSRNHPALFRHCFRCSAVLFSHSTHLKTCYLNESDCALNYWYTHSQWFCIDSAGFDSQCMSCVCTSAFLHVFYVSYMFVIFVSFVCMYVCTYVCVFVCICSMYVCECVCLCLCSLFKLMMFSIWDMGSEKVILWDTVCCYVLVLLEFML